MPATARWRSSSRTSRAASRPTSPTPRSLRTRLFDAAGQGIEITDFAPRFFNRGRMFRPAQLVRRVRPLLGHAAHARRRSGRASTGAASQPAVTRGSNHLRYVGAGADAAPEHRRAARPTSLAETLFVAATRPINFMLGPDETLSGGIEDTARDFEQETVALLAPLDARAWRCRWNGRRR